MGGINDYYNSKQDVLSQLDVNTDMNVQYNLFEKYLYEGAKILDCGCRSYRDSNHFIMHGYEVTTIDYSELNHKIASKLTGLDVQNMLLKDNAFENQFDGIWACDLLLNVPVEEITDILVKFKKVLAPKGILYISFRHGEFTKEKEERYFNEMNEVTFTKLINKVGEFTIKETYLSSDVGSEREGEKWINTILIKNDNTELKTRNEMEAFEKVEPLEGEVIIDSNGSKILKVSRKRAKVDLMGSLDRLMQCVNIENVANTIHKGAKYVVQIPRRYQKQFESGEYFLNKNKITGIEWPTLMKKAENGRYQFVDNLPIQQKEFIEGNPFQDICNSYHNIVMQQQLAQIADTVSETYESVKMIELGQQDDRVALIETGKEEILYAMTLRNEEEKKEYLRLGTDNLLNGKNQIGEALKRRVEAFKPLPENGVAMFFTTLAKPDYLSKKDDEVEAIQECYSMYIQATKMLAATFAYTGEIEAVELTFNRSVAFLKEVDFSKVKTIELSHKDVDLSEWFFNRPIEYIEAEKAPCLEAAKEYDYVQIEITGDELLEVMSDGK